MKRARKFDIRLSATPDEAAAVAAALERYADEAAPTLGAEPLADGSATIGRWKRTAFEEAVRRAPDFTEAMR